MWLLTIPCICTKQTTQSHQLNESRNCLKAFSPLVGSLAPYLYTHDSRSRAVSNNMGHPQCMVELYALKLLLSRMTYCSQFSLYFNNLANISSRKIEEVRNCKRSWQKLLKPIICLADAQLWRHVHSTDFHRGVCLLLVNLSLLLYPIHAIPSWQWYRVELAKFSRCLGNNIPDKLIKLTCVPKTLTGNEEVQLRFQRNSFCCFISSRNN